MKQISTFLLMLGAFTLMSISAKTAQKSEKMNPDSEDVKFRIQICSYENHVPYDKVELLRSLGKVMVIKKDGIATYYSKVYATEQEATTQVPYYVNAGFEDAFEVAQVGDDFYNLADYHKYKNEKKHKDEKDPSIRIYK